MKAASRISLSPFGINRKPSNDNSSRKNRPKDAIKQNATFYTNLDVDGAPTLIEDIFALCLSWCNDQASLEPSLKEVNDDKIATDRSSEVLGMVNMMAAVKPNPTTTTIDDVEIIPNHRKGSVEFHYDLHRDNIDSFDHNFVELCIDSEMMYNYLQNTDGDTTSKTDPFFAKVCQFLMQRNALRSAAILVFYNVIIEVVKGNMSGDNAFGYYGNAVGSLCIAWIYGWGYYIYAGTYQKTNLLEGDQNRKERIDWIKTKLEKIMTGDKSDEYTEEDIKSLLEEANEMGASCFESTIIENAIRYDFTLSKGTRKLQSWFFPDFKKYFCNSEQTAKLSATVGYYELLDISGKYLSQQRLYGKKSRNQFIEIFLTVGFIIDFLIVSIIGLYYYWVNWYSCFKTGEQLEVNGQYNCNAVEFGMRYQLGYILFALNLWLNLAGVIITYAGLIYGSSECHNLVNSFLRRYKLLRKLKIPDFENVAEFSKEEMLVKLLGAYLKRDCYERYILIKNLMEKISVLWSGMLVTILLASTIFSIYLYTILLFTGFALYGTVAMLLFAICCCLTPIICCSYANSAMDKLVFSVKTSGPDDYSAIGGREAFLAFANDTPCFWYIFGFAITPSWLAGFMGGSASAIAVSVLVTKFTS